MTNLENTSDSSQGSFCAIVIAVDGPSASGKGTIARRLAAHLDYAYLDTGLLYRAVGLLVEAAKVPMDKPDEIAVFVNELEIQKITAKLIDPTLRGDTAAQAASKVAVVPDVRAKLLQFQKDFACLPPDGKAGAVLDGRDIGTVIAPNANVKIFVTADAAVRARRRWKELRERGENATYDAVLADLVARDERDAKREAAPTVAAADAVKLDNSGLTADDAFEAALAIVTEKLKL